MSDPFKDALRRGDECLRPTPETDDLDWSSAIGDTLEQRRTQLARIHGVTSRLERHLAEAREENARLREAFQRIADCTDFAEVAELVGKSHDPHA